MTYKEYREKRQAEYNALPIFYAFGDEQFKEALHERGLTLDNLDQVCRVSAGFALKKDLPIIKAFLEKPDELPELMKDPSFAEDAFYSEMANHEYHINWDADWDVLNCFGNIPGNDADESLEHYFDLCGFEPQTRSAYMKARSRFMNDALENDWY